MQTNRALAAATAIARDFPHMMDVARLDAPQCVVALDKWRARELIMPNSLPLNYASDRMARTFQFSELPAGIVKQMRSTKNKRMLAAITFAVETDASVTVEMVSDRLRPQTGRMTVHADLFEINGRSTAALTAAATYLSVTHSEMVRIATEKASRSGDAPTFGIQYPAAPIVCIVETTTALHRITSWVVRQLADDKEARGIAKAADVKAKSPLSDSMPSILRLRHLMETITPEGLAEADMPLFLEAYEIVERLAA